MGICRSVNFTSSNMGCNLSGNLKSVHVISLANKNEPGNCIKVRTWSISSDHFSTVHGLDDMLGV